jgi:hypothetical protein
MSKLIGKASLGSGDFAKTDESKLIFREDSLSPNDLKESTENLFDRLEEEDYQRLKKDIKERGIIDPLICDNSFTLLTGNNRLSIAKELKLEKIPVRILQNNLSHKEKEKLHVLDNLNRRQLTYEEKKKFISMYYNEDLKKDNRGGNQSKKDESSRELSLDLSKKIEKETGIKAGTAKRIVADIRKESKPKKANKSKPVKVTNSKQSKKKLQDRLNEVEKEIETLQAEKDRLEKQLARMK